LNVVIPEKEIDTLKITITILSYNKNKTLLKCIFHKISNYNLGEGKTTYTFSVSVYILSTNILFCVVPAGGEGGSGRNGTEICWR